MKLSGMIATLPLEHNTETGVRIYFCACQSPLAARPPTRDTNGPLRQYWPKGADLRQLTSTECDAVALQLNIHPERTSSGLRSPPELRVAMSALLGPAGQVAGCLQRRGAQLRHNRVPGEDV